MVGEGFGRYGLVTYASLGEKDEKVRVADHTVDPDGGSAAGIGAACWHDTLDVADDNVALQAEETTDAELSLGEAVGEDQAGLVVALEFDD